MLTFNNIYAHPAADYSNVLKKFFFNYWVYFNKSHSPLCPSKFSCMDIEGMPRKLLCAVDCVYSAHHPDVSLYKS